METTVENLLNKLNTVQLAFKTVNLYTRIELIMHFKLNSTVHQYVVLRKGRKLIETPIIDNAVEVYNSYNDSK